MASLSSSPLSGETAADLRALYRASEARAARLRVLVEASRTLAASDPDQLAATAGRIAAEAAHLAGYARGAIFGPQDRPLPDADTLVVPLQAPGSAEDQMGSLVLEHRVGTPSADDHEALGILAQLIGGALAARAREARLATLLTELLGAQEAERSRVAHELHDGVAQSAAALARRLDLAADGDPADLAEAAQQARALVRELRQVIAGMRPPALDDLGLAAALHQMIDDAGAKHVALEVTLKERPPVAIETALFRIVQEGFSNARAHAGAGAQISIRVHAEEGQYRAEIGDNGEGFDPAAAPIAASGKGFGLAYMRERVGRLGGRLRIMSAPGKGCRIVAELPAG